MCDQEKANEFRSQEKVVRCVVQWLDKCLPDCDLLEQIRDLADELHDKAADFEKPPKLIQGYTAENWQEIIDGGYLCEFSQDGDRWHVSVLSECRTKTTHNFCMPHLSVEISSCFRYCRPAKIKGVMRPIFVEPVDKDAWCVFMWRDTEGGWGVKGDGQWDEFKKENSTAYIEV